MIWSKLHKIFYVTNIIRVAREEIERPKSRLWIVKFFLLSFSPLSYPFLFPFIQKKISIFICFQVLFFNFLCDPLAFFTMLFSLHRASLLVQRVKNTNAGRCKRCVFDPWVGKIPWRRAWQPIPVFLPGESHGQRSLVGCRLWGRTESDTTEVT